MVFKSATTLNGARLTCGARLTYDAFGPLFGRTGATATSFLFGGEFGYYFDNSQRYNVDHRILDPLTGRWISLDPIGFAGRLPNLYCYVGNNPVRWVDPSGQSFWGGIWCDIKWLFFHPCPPPPPTSPPPTLPSPPLPSTPTPPPTPVPTMCRAGGEEPDPCTNSATSRENCEACNNKHFQECLDEAKKEGNFLEMANNAGACHNTNVECQDVCDNIGPDPDGQGDASTACWTAAKEIQKFFKPKKES